MYCPICNNTNLKKGSEKYEVIEHSKEYCVQVGRACSWCNGVGKISFHRYIQLKLGDICWLTGGSNGNDRECDTDEIADRCVRMIASVFDERGKKFDKSRLAYPRNGTGTLDVIWFYARQFKGHDCR